MRVHSPLMVTMLDDSLLTTIGNLRDFVDGALPISFRPLRREERSEWIRHTLIRFRYKTLRRTDKTVVRRYIMKIANLSRSQLNRHIQAYGKRKPICTSYKRYQPSQHYTQSDIELLAETDNLHQRINGAATIAIMREEHRRGDRRYERLQNISIAHLYRFRGTKRYQLRSVTYEKTNPVQRSIGERRKPEPNGKPGYLRTDSVHQGDHKGKKGVYHINSVDEMTQWEVPVAVETLQEGCVEPALDEAFLLFPFVIENFHSDNGSEYINDVVAQFLVRWQAKQTKSRPRISNDNGLAETKNGAVIRKHMTHFHIPQIYATRINKFYREHLIPYLNFHRPCAFPEVALLPNGKKKITYPKESYKTPYEKLKSLPGWQQYLCPGITPEMLEERARAKTPNQAARDLQKAKQKLFDIVLPHYRDML